MIDLYYWPTPNGHKITMFLEEAGLPYRMVPVNIGAGEQFKPEFLAISPNNRMPAIVDHTPTGGGEPISVFESGAILLYLAEKTEQFLPDGRPRPRRGARVAILASRWARSDGRTEPSLLPLCPGRDSLCHRTLRQGDQPPLRSPRTVASRTAAGAYSIADMAAYPWIVPHEAQGQKLADFPNLDRWFAAIACRPATVRAYEVGKRFEGNLELTDEQRKILFGQTART
jgi:GST-like protein